MTGTLVFVVTFLRRDRWMLFWWILGGAALFWVTAYSVDGLYTTQAEYDAAAASMEGNAAFVAMAGPARALNTLGGQVAWQTTAFGAILAAMMSMFLLGRHTRAEEEAGRDELLRAAPVGRYATTTAAVLLTLGANLVLGVAVALSLSGFDLARPDTWALGLGLTVTGWTFTGTALIAMQLTSSARSAYAIAGVVIGVAYVLRAVGDVGNGVASWLSPIGWYQAMHQFSGLRWWPALVSLAFTGVCVAAGYRLHARRDYGAGIVAARPGPATASAGLGSSVGLAVRQYRGLVVGWTAGMFFAGLAYGTIGDDVKSVLGGSDTTQELFVQSGTDIVTGFFGTSLLMLAVIAGGYAISSAISPRREEENGHLEVLLATALPRTRWLGAQVLMTVGGVVLVLVGAGAGVGLGYLAVTGDSGTAWSYAWPVLQYAAPVLVLSALTRLLFGLRPRLVVLAWVPLVWAVVVMLFGDLFGIWQWAQDLSPFEHLPMVPAEDFAWGPVLAVAAVAVLISAAGQVAFARRDVG